MYDDLGDMFAMLQAYILPASTGIFTLVESITICYRPLVVILASTDPDDIRIIGVDRHTAYRVRTLPIEYWLIRRPAIDSLPDAS